MSAEGNTGGGGVRGWRVIQLKETQGIFWDWGLEGDPAEMSAVLML